MLHKNSLLLIDNITPSCVVLILQMVLKIQRKENVKQIQTQTYVWIKSKYLLNSTPEKK